MKSAIEYREIDGGMRFYAVLAFIGVFILAALGATYYMEHNGHWVTGMTNQVVWGTPHVFAVFLIVAASGALNVASISSVFSKTPYKPLARLSGLLAITLLVGGLAVLVLDLGRPDRLIVAMTYYNFKSIFAWNIILYNGFLAITIVYLWMMMERKMNDYTKPAGFFAFRLSCVWRPFTFLPGRKRPEGSIRYESIFELPTQAKAGPASPRGRRSKHGAYCNNCGNAPQAP